MHSILYYLISNTVIELILLALFYTSILLSDLRYCEEIPVSQIYLTARERWNYRGCVIDLLCGILWNVNKFPFHIARKDIVVREYWMRLKMMLYPYAWLNLNFWLISAGTLYFSQWNDNIIEKKLIFRWQEFLFGAIRYEIIQQENVK